VEVFIGAGLALSVGLSATFLGLDRDRAFYPTVMIVIASYYGLFAVMSGSVQALALESIAIVAFLAASIAGFKWSLWLVVAALASGRAALVADLLLGLRCRSGRVPGLAPVTLESPCCCDLTIGALGGIQ
jgi:hypothetical protein